MDTGSNDANVKKLINECQRIEEDSLYTGEAHHIIGNDLMNQTWWLKIIPASITVLSAFAVLGNYHKDIFQWFTLITGFLTMYNVITEPERKSQQHISAGKNFVVLKHEARSLRESFKDFMDTKEFYHAVRRLREKYNLLVQYIPPTNEKAFEKARKRIKKGIHYPDYKEK
jgi:hypothetical protein